VDGRVIIDRPVVRYVGPHGKRHRFGLFRTAKKKKANNVNFSRLNMMPVTSQKKKEKKKKKRGKRRIMFPSRKKKKRQ
jgi:hypothetical protein